MVGPSRPDLLGTRSTNSLFCSRTQQRRQPVVASLGYQRVVSAEACPGSVGKGCDLLVLRVWHRAARNCNSRNSPATHIDMGVWGS